MSRYRNQYPSTDDMFGPGNSTEMLGMGGSTEMLGMGSSTEKLHRVSLGAIGDAESPSKWKRRRSLWISIALALAILASGGAVVGALVAKNIIHFGSKSAATSGSSHGQGGSTSRGPGGTGGTGAPLPASCSTPDEIPSTAKGTWIDPTSWMDLTDFNCTFTDQTVGSLPIVGLNSTWDDSKQANPNVPPLNQPWGSYGNLPFRGVNLGGWLSLEPFITPSIFDASTAVDEYTLCTKLGPTDAATTLEKHYSTFITEDDFRSIAAAGLDHVRIPYSYWAVKTYDNDPYVVGVSWRYLLRGIEWARRYGLRVKLDLHGVPGSQNGWNHSGKQGTIDWLLGPDGPQNANRTLDLHNQLSQFFAQDRYKNIVVFYGLVNEPAVSIPQDALVTWTQQAYQIVHGNGVTATVIFGEAQRGLAPWQGKLTGYGNSLAIDVHEYMLFDPHLIVTKHADRVTFACQTWVGQISASLDTTTGFGPTMTGEWSQADTDCANYLNGVGNGARWTGTFGGTTTPECPTQDSQCNCDLANANASNFTSDYKQFLLTWAESQMTAFEKSWGWFYWTWKTESAPLWSYQAGLQGNFMPPLAYQRDWDCSKSIPSFGSLPEYY